VKVLLSRRRFAALAAALLVAAAPLAAHAALPDPVRFGIAIESGDVRAARNWLDQGLPPDYLADRIGTGLMIAAWEGNIEMMELFLSRGANVNRANQNGEQALLLAAWHGHVDAVRWLLDRGAQINRPGLAWSALHYAVFAGHQEVAELLLARGADVNARSTNGSSVLMMAVREGRDKLAMHLLDRGADPSIRNDWGEDAFVWAMRNGHVKLARALGTPERIAAAARAPDSFGAPTRSHAVPTRIDDLLKEMRIAEAEGRLTPELQLAYLNAVRELRRASVSVTVEAAPPRDEPPRVLEIRARRGSPGQESATLIYDGGRAQDATVPASRPPAEQQVVEPRIPRGLVQ